MAQRHSSEFIDVELVQTHLKQAQIHVAKDAAEAFGSEMHSRFEHAGSEWGASPLAFDSPLEAIFWIWWMAVTREDLFGENVYLDHHVQTRVSGADYCIDFVVRPRPGKFMGKAWFDSVKDDWPLVGVELDGHAFHEKTLEQVTYRNQRDRDLQMGGWQIFHFSFYEFNTEPSMSVVQVLDYIRQRACDLSFKGK